MNRHPADMTGDWLRWAITVFAFAILVVYGDDLWRAWWAFTAWLGGEGG